MNKGLNSTHVLQQTIEALNQRLFFIVGCQKSGTTWLQKMLNAHPQAICHGEAYFIPLLVPLVKQMITNYNKNHKAGELGSFSNEQLCAVLTTLIGLKLNDWQSTKNGVLAIGEKTPEHAQCLDLLDHILPNIHVIHLVRDPRDVVVSGHHHNIRQKGEAFLKQFPTQESYANYTITHHWRAYIEAAEAWGRLNPDRFVRVRYEDLLSDCAATLEPIWDLLGLDKSEEVISSVIDAGRPSKQPKQTGRQESGSYFRKGKSGSWRKELEEPALKKVMQLSEPWMRQLGYLELKTTEDLK